MTVARRVRYAPAEGWATFGCVVVMCLMMAAAIDDARWVLGRPEFLDGLVLCAVGGVIAGFIGAKVGWGRWPTYLIGSLFAALLIPLLTGLIGNPKGAPVGELYRATADSVVSAYVDLAILNLSATPEYLHYILALSLVVWATSMFAAYAVFGHRRPLNAVVMVGLVLVGNMSMTVNDEQEMPFLIVFSLAALLLLIRAHVFDEQAEWIRRRIGDPSSISSVYQRGGIGFVAAAVTASFVLTQTAASAPLAGAWDGVQDGLINISRSLQRYLPTGGSNRALGLTFGASTPVGQLWTTDGSLAVNIQRDPTDTGRYYWRAVTYDRIDPKGWGQSTSITNPVPPGAPLLEDLADDVDPTGLHKLTFTVTPVDFRGSTVLSPQTPVGVNERVRLTTVGKDGYFATIDRDGGSGPYTVTALTPVEGNDEGELNEAALRATETTYPDEIKKLYIPLADGSLGPNTLLLEKKILSTAPSTAPYDIANQIVEELHSQGYRYTTDVRDLDCANLSTAECFATYKRGFCQYYAATMAVILRDLDIPARIAEGFLPGTRDRASGIEPIPFSNAHAWVEVYFPGFGWVPFDPTGGNVAQLTPLPSGIPQASPSARSSAVIPAASRKADIDGRDTPGSAVGPTGGRGTPLGPMVAVGALLVLVVGGLAFVAWQRGPRGSTSADGAYGTVTRIASRLGFAPRPAQTVYEYAGALGEVLPLVRPELETVATAKVRSTYAREILGEEQLERLRAAQRRLRINLLRLAFRRRQRRR